MITSGTKLAKYIIDDILQSLHRNYFQIVLAINYIPFPYIMPQLGPFRYSGIALCKPE